MLLLERFDGVADQFNRHSVVVRSLGGDAELNIRVSVRSVKVTRISLDRFVENAQSTFNKAHFDQILPVLQPVVPIKLERHLEFFVKPKPFVHVITPAGEVCVEVVIHQEFEQKGILPSNILHDRGVILRECPKNLDLGIHD